MIPVNCSAAELVEPPRTFSRSELEVFGQVMALIGADETDQDGRSGTGEVSSLTFNLETSPTDEVQMVLSDHGPEYGGLHLDLWMYPEDEMRDATPQQMAATVARWLRDTAAKLDAVAAS